MRRKSSPPLPPARKGGYADLLGGLTKLLEEARRASVRSVNAVMTATYWEIGRRIVEYEQGGQKQAEYGTVLLKRLGADLTSRFGRGFSWRNLYLMRNFYLAYPHILQTPSAKSAAPQIGQTMSGEFPLNDLARVFPLPWSHYVCLFALDDPHKRDFYEEEARRGGWSVRQLDRQINAMLYERVALSRKKGELLRKAEQSGSPATPTSFSTTVVCGAWWPSI